MNSDHDDSRIISLAGLLLSATSLMVSLHLGGYVIIALVGAGIGVGVGVVLPSRRRR
jgi:hypothetical protein